MITRRDFVRVSGSCVAQAGLFAMFPPLLRSPLEQRPATADLVEPWGRIEQVGDSVWACISTPFGTGPEIHRTFSNGGIIAGRSGVLVVEGFASDSGAQWMADMARERTGREPTHVVLTHYHGDHSAGLVGYTLGSRQKPIYVTTAATRERLASRPPIVEVLSRAELIEAGTPRVIDLGGRKVTITPRSGHTPSDLTVSIDDPAVVFGGDLVWNGLFPNYVDAIPSVLSREVRAIGNANLKADIVPGHGSIPSREEFGRYLELLDLLEDTARRAHAAGHTPAEAAARLKLPPALAEWTMFSPQYVQVALEAWEREL